MLMYTMGDSTAAHLLFHERKVEIRYGGAEAGKLLLEDGMLCFQGDKALAAELFYATALKGICDHLVEFYSLLASQAGARLMDLPSIGEVILSDNSGGALRTIGVFFFYDGGLSFRGDLDAEAREWFEGHLKPLTDFYLQQSIMNRGVRRWVAEGSTPAAYLDHCESKQGC